MFALQFEDIDCYIVDGLLNSRTNSTTKSSPIIAHVDPIPEKSTLNPAD